MDTKDKKIWGNSPKALNLLNQALQLEYSLIFYYPRLASAIEDKEARNLVLKLGSDSIKHADVVASAIQELGGVPLWSFEPFPEGIDLIKIFQVQLEKEKLALQLHLKNAGLAPAGSLRNRFENMAKEEESHIQIVKNILSNQRVAL